MSEKLGVFLLLLHLALAQDDGHHWDIAVVVKDTIELLQSNGTVIGSTVQESSILKAVTFDNVRHQFLVSGMAEDSFESPQNDTIFAVQLTSETDMAPILQDLPDDVQGLSVDPIDDILYWTDSINKTINYISLSNESYHSKILVEFRDKNPQGIALDVCGRKIYWTNTDFEKATIESTTIDGLETKVLIDKDLFAPYGIAVDHYLKKLYWADMRQGIYFRIESANLDGTNREIVYRGTHSKPFGIAVDRDYVYWSDVNNNNLWRISKFKPQVEVIRAFEDRPMGVVAKNVDIRNLADCKALEQAIEEYQGSIKENYIYPVSSPPVAHEVQSMACLNGGQTVNGACKCPRGSSGKYCEVSLCHNYCLHGECRVSDSGYMSCQCADGYGGRRCERNVCDGYCLNGGECIYKAASPKSPKCSCLDGFGGMRCEINLNIGHICSMFCQGKEEDMLISRQNNFICRCDHGTFSILDTNATAELLTASDDHLPIIEHFRDPAFLILSAAMLIMCIIVIVLAYFVCTLKRRPRIKKRIIVNKNVTPLTYRPHPNTEQCEITIENCCNMNVCETPCFDPPKLRSFSGYRHEDKKKLLSNMENGEDHY